MSTMAGMLSIRALTKMAFGGSAIGSTLGFGYSTHEYWTSRTNRNYYGRQPDILDIPLATLGCGGLGYVMGIAYPVTLPLAIATSAVYAAEKIASARKRKKDAAYAAEKIASARRDQDQAK
jgi:hypothetical protein